MTCKILLSDRPPNAFMRFLGAAAQAWPDSLTPSIFRRQKGAVRGIGEIQSVQLHMAASETSGEIARRITNRGTELVEQVLRLTEEGKIEEAGIYVKNVIELTEEVNSIIAAEVKRNSHSRYKNITLLKEAGYRGISSELQSLAISYELHIKGGMTAERFNWIASHTARTLAYYSHPKKIDQLF